MQTKIQIFFQNLKNNPLALALTVSVSVLIVGGAIIAVFAMQQDKPRSAASSSGQNTTGNNNANSQGDKKDEKSGTAEQQNGQTQPGGTNTGTSQTTGGGTSTGGGGGTSTPPNPCSGVAHHVPGGADGTGTCWPGPNNTGVPAGTVLTNYTGPCVISTANTVIDSKIIDGCDGVGIQAANVTIKNSKINTYIALDTDRPNGLTWSLTIQDSEINAGNVLQSALSNAQITALRINVHGAINGMECDPPITHCSIRDSYIHGPTFVNDIDTHLGGFLSDGGTNITIQHNTIMCDTPVNNVGGGCTGDLNLIPNFAAIDGALIEHNLLGAAQEGSYCTYGGEKSSSPTPHSYNVVYRDNIFQRGANNKCAAYGPVTGFEISNTGNQWVNNKWDDGGTVDPAN